MSYKKIEENSSNINKNKGSTDSSRIHLSPWKWIDGEWVMLSFKPSKNEVSND